MSSKIVMHGRKLYSLRVAVVVYAHGGQEMDAAATVTDMLRQLPCVTHVDVEKEPLPIFPEEAP